MRKSSALLAGSLLVLKVTGLFFSGGYTLDRHGAPRMGCHAVQIEIDRTLYLDATQRDPGPGLRRMRAVVAAIALAAGDSGQFALAAE